MITSNLGDNYSSNMVKAKVELYDGSTLAAECTCGGYLSDFRISREGELGKFFGFGVCHNLTMNLIDLNKELRIYEGFTAKVCLGNGTIFDCPYPDLEITDVVVDKKSGDIKVTAYDPLHRAAELTYADLGITAPYTLKQLTEACARLIGVSLGTLDSTFNLYYEKGANYNDDENLRLILNHIAEVTQTIYYINKDNKLIFKRLSRTSVHSYDRNDYYEFETAEHKTIKAICNATEIGENYQYPMEVTDGVVQYVRENGLWNLRTDITTLLEAAVNRVSGLELYQFDLDWSGDYRLEIGDCITIIYEDGSVNVFVLNDVIHYAGTLSEETSWQYKDSDNDTFANPTNIGDKINQTFARVDKIEKTILLQVGDTVSTVVEEILPEKIEELTSDMSSDIEGLKAHQITSEAKLAQLELTTDSITQRVANEEQKTTIFESDIAGIRNEITEVTTNVGQLEISDDNITASVESVKETTKSSIDNINKEIATLSNKVSTSVTLEQVEIQILQTLSEGVDKVTTSTGYTFDDDGLHISKSNSSMSSTLDEEGLEVSRSSTPVLTAKSDGVKALNLTAQKYLTVENCRFEKYGYGRMGCYWVE